MLKPILITAIILQSILMVVTFVVKLKEPIPQHTIVQPPSMEDVLEETEQPLPELVLEINQRNKAIRSFSCDYVVIKTWEKGMRFRLNGELYYEKDLTFRMILDSVFGKELDLGSNEEVFWYWSRRDKHPGLYWANHEDFNQTRLKTPFNPMFMRDTLGLNEIPQKGAKIIDKEDSLLIVYERTNSMGEPILYSVVVGKKTKQIDGFLVTDIEGVPLALAEIKESQNGLPLQILYTWYEEGKILLIEFRNAKTNLHIPASNWQPPNETPKINMAEE